MSTNTRDIRRARLWPYRSREIKEDEVAVGKLLYIDSERDRKSLKNAFCDAFEEADVDHNNICERKLCRIVKNLRKEEDIIRRKANATELKEFYERQVSLSSFSINSFVFSGLQPLTPVGSPPGSSSLGLLPNTPSISNLAGGLSLNTPSPRSPMQPASSDASLPLGSPLSRGIDRIVVQSRMRFLKGVSDGSEHLLRIQQLTRDKKNLQKRVAVLQKRVVGLRLSKRALKKFTRTPIKARFVGDKDQEEVLCRLRTSLREKSAQIGILENTVLELSERLQKDQMIETMEGKGFSPAVDLCIIKLTGLGVADGKVGQVMQAVVEMCGKQLSHVPSARSIGRRIADMNTLAKCQIKQILEDAMTDNMARFTILSDETTKLSRKLQIYGLGIKNEAGGPPGVLYLGLGEVAGKHAQTSLDLLLKKINQISCINGHAGKFAEKLIAATKNAMSDRAATQLKFNQLFSTYRSEILPQIIKNFESLTESQQKAFKRFNEFSCQLHVIANLSPVVLAALAEHEAQVTKEAVDPAMPSVYVVLRECARYFSERSAGHHPEYVAWMDFAQVNGLSEARLPALLGHRFNIVFTLAARVFRHREHYISFIQTRVADDSPLQLLRQSLGDPLIISHLQVLGMLDQYLTGPLWRMAEGSLHVMDMCHYAKDFLSWVRERISSPARFFNKEVPILSIIPTTDPFKPTGPLLTFLTSLPPSNHALVAVTFSLTATERYLQEMFRDFLPGGHYFKNQIPLRRETSSVPLTARAVGFTDCVLSKAPNANINRAESVLLFTKKHVADWFNGLGKDEQSSLLLLARNSRVSFQKLTQSEKQSLSQQISQRMQEKETSVKAKRAREYAYNTNLFNSIFTYGFWDDVTRMDVASAHLSDTELRKAMEVQLRFRQKVLKQDPPSANFFRLSSGGVKPSLSELRGKILTLISLARNAQVTVGSDLVGKSIRVQMTTELLAAHVTDVARLVEDGPVYVAWRADDNDEVYSLTLDEFMDDVNLQRIFIVDDDPED